LKPPLDTLANQHLGVRDFSIAAQEALPVHRLLYEDRKQRRSMHQQYLIVQT
jgi:hypothetical protein